MKDAAETKDRQVEAVIEWCLAVDSRKRSLSPWMTRVICLMEVD